MARLNYLEWALVGPLKWSPMGITMNENKPGLLEVDWECDRAGFMLGGGDGNQCAYLIPRLRKLRTMIWSLVGIGDEISRDC